MTYSLTDAPIASHTLANDQPLIENNNLYWANVLLKDHQIGAVGGTNSGVTFEGRHIQVAFSNRNGSPPTVSGIGDGTNALLYSNNGNIFFGSATGAGAFQLTTYNSGSNFGGTTNGWTFLPGGLILQYGQVASPGTSGQVTFPIAFPSGSAPFSIQVTLERGSGNQTVTVDNGSTNAAPNSTKFGYLSSSGGSNFVFWIAIGK
jgi:hypothetical protein